MKVGASGVVAIASGAGVVGKAGVSDEVMKVGVPGARSCKWVPEVWS